jgi:hypothetical protein
VAEHRRAADRRGPRYPADRTDVEWALVERLIPPAKHGGRPRRVDGREELNAKLAEVREQFRGAKVNSNENPTNAEISLNFIRNLALLMLGRHAEAPGLMDDLARHEASVGDAPIIASNLTQSLLPHGWILARAGEAEAAARPLRAVIGAFRAAALRCRRRPSAVTCWPVDPTVLLLTGSAITGP